MRWSSHRARRARRAAAISVAAAVASHCSTCPPDPDGSPRTANPLELESAQPDVLLCSSRILQDPGPDCIDYYRVSVAQEGTLEIRIAPRPGTHPPSAYRVALLGGNERLLDRQTGAPGEPVLVHTQTRGGTYYAAVAAQGGALDYEIFAHLELPEPVVVEEPKFRTVEATVVELEGHGCGEQVVVLDRGEEEGLVPSQKGQLLDGERVLAELEVVKAFRDGSRARIEGCLGGVLSDETRAVFLVPADDP